jgi:hypothetical protein
VTPFDAIAMQVAQAKLAAIRGLMQELYGTVPEGWKPPKQTWQDRYRSQWADEFNYEDDY